MTNQPTDEQIDLAVSTMLVSLGYYALPLDDHEGRDALAQRIADSLPSRIVRAAQWAVQA